MRTKMSATSTELSSFNSPAQLSTDLSFGRQALAKSQDFLKLVHID